MSTASKSKIPVILLFGPTAVGKTAVIEDLCSTGYEIVNADSQQVYRYLNIGTAKPSPALLDRIPHHLVDFLNPSKQFSVGCFVKEADRAIVNIHRRGNIPVVSGGTAYYFYHFIYGIPPAPQADEQVRKQLLQRLELEGRDALWGELEQVDPESAERLHPNDTQRLLRALEVYHSAGFPLSSFHLQSVPREKYRFLTIGLNRPRVELYRRINERVERMWEFGLPEEFRLLKEMGFGEGDPGMQGIGYREFFLLDYTDKYTLTGLKEEIKKNSRRYAKRQITFFKRIPDAEWFLPYDAGKLRLRIENFLHLI